VLRAWWRSVLCGPRCPISCGAARLRSRVGKRGPLADDECPDRSAIVIGQELHQALRKLAAIFVRSEKPWCTPTLDSARARMRSTPHHHTQTANHVLVESGFGNMKTLPKCDFERPPPCLPASGEVENMLSKRLMPYGIMPPFVDVSLMSRRR